MYEQTFRRLDKIKATIEELLVENQNLRSRLRKRDELLVAKVRRLEALVTGLNILGAARERVIKQLDEQLNRIPKQELQTVGDTPTPERTDEGDSTRVVPEASG